MGWEPQQEGVVQLATLLSEFQKPGSNQTQVVWWCSSSHWIPSHRPHNHHAAVVWEICCSSTQSTMQSEGQEMGGKGRIIMQRTNLLPRRLCRLAWVHFGGLGPRLADAAKASAHDGQLDTRLRPSA
jgi:hypothetical protein